ncbi:MAG: hypothetical protein M1435_02220 [Actinobacteria bacterium]|jgi:hypothetical protein|nr:hypothetical protein [Actinomycetota bacterium]MDA8303233.1 hypothetical protein [Actinomycetota bacterium]
MAPKNDPYDDDQESTRLFSVPDEGSLQVTPNLPSVIPIMRRFNESRTARAELYQEARQADDVVKHAARERATSRDEADLRRDNYSTAQAKEPSRRSPRYIMLALALVAALIEIIPANFAAQAGGGGRTTSDFITAILWLGLIAGEGFLAWASLRSSRRLRRLATWGMATYILALTFLRYEYLVTTGWAAVSAAIGAALLGFVTSIVLVAGYKALRAAQSAVVHKAKRLWRAAEREDEARLRELTETCYQRDRLVDAYISLISPYLMQVVAAMPEGRQESAMSSLEGAVRAHLSAGGQR